MFLVEKCYIVVNYTGSKLFYLGNKKEWKKSILCRVEYPDGSFWLYDKNGCYHSLTGPAINKKGNKRWFIHGNEMSEAKFQSEIKDKR